MKNGNKINIMLITLLFFSLLSLVMFPAPVQAETPESYYKDKAITFVVPYKPGGGYDTYARLIAPALSEKTGSKVVIRNMHGGASYVALNHVYHAKPNGRTLLILDGMVATLNQLIGDPKSKTLDMLKFEWLARVSYEQGAILIGTKSGFKTLADMRNAKRTIKFSGTKGSAVQIIGATFIEIAGLKAEIYQGFGGSSPIAMAIMRGELDGMGNSASSAVSFAKQEEIFPFCIVSKERSPLMPEVPKIGELIKMAPEQKKWVDRLESILGMGRSIVTTPGTPPERVEFLRKKLNSLLTDKDFLKTANKVKRPIDYLTGDEAQKNVTGFLKMPEKDIKEIKYVLLEKYLK